MNVFISSIVQGFESVRDAARRAVESMGMQALMLETAAARSAPSRAALFELIDRADVVLLLLGPRYGERGASGVSPTEDEFRCARELGRPILALVQEGDARDPDQEAFVRRVRGSWEEGYFAPSFRDDRDVVFRIVQALSEHARRHAPDTPKSPRPSAHVEGATRGLARAESAWAQEAALRLARGDERRGYVVAGSPARVVLVPVGEPELLDVVALDDEDLPDRLAGLARETRVVTQSVSLERQVSREGVQLIGSEGRSWSEPKIAIGATGTILVEADVAADGMLGSGQVDHARIVALIERATAYATAVWEEVDSGGQVSAVAAAVAVPDATHKLYVLEPTGNSSRVPMSNPQTVIAPDPPLVVPVGDVTSSGTRNRLAVSLKRAFTDFGAIHPER